MRANAHVVFIVIHIRPMPCVGVKAALLQHGLDKGLLLDGVKFEAVEDFAQQFGFHRETVATHLKRAGMTLRTSLTDEAFCQRVRQTYETTGTVKGTAQQLGVSKDTVRKVLRG